MDINEIINILREQEKLKILASQQLASFLSIEVIDIFHSYIKNTIPLSGLTDKGMEFFSMD